MKSKSGRIKGRKKIDWAAKVRTFKAELNNLTAAQRRRLLNEALAEMNQAAATDVRRG